MKKLDCLGEMCPIPILKLQKALDDIRRGKPHLIITDHSCTVTAVREFCALHDLSCAVDEVMNGVWEIAVAAAPLADRFR